MNIAIFAVLIVIAVLLLWLVLIQRRALKWSSTNGPFVLDQAVGDILLKVMSGVEHAADVSAVLKLLSEVEENPDALELVKSYPETVRAAAMVHYCNSLASAAHRAHKSLEDHVKDGLRVDGANISQDKRNIDDLHEMLEAAVAASRRLNIKPVS